LGNEQIDVFDEQNRPLNKSLEKKEAHERGEWHRSSHVWIFNSRGEILLQHRAAKGHYPDMLDVSISGHARSGEKPIETALRELKEELGLKVKKRELSLYKVKPFSSSHGNVKDNEHCHIYFLKFDGKAEDLKLQDEEVRAVRFFSIKELSESMKRNPEKHFLDEEYRLYLLEIVEKVKELAGLKG